MKTTLSGAGSCPHDRHMAANRMTAVIILVVAFTPRYCR